mgnify:CR=1 FL=1
MEMNMIIVAIYLIILNLLSFSAMLYDKRIAGKGKRRVSEKRLFLFGVLGGSLGIYIAMRAFRHKMKHLSFTLGIPLLISVNIVSVVLIYKLWM